MPELPEVEVTRLGLEPYIVGQVITKVIVRHPKLRWPIPKLLKKYLVGQTLLTLSRRGKYLLWHFPNGTLIIHLGMSGKLQITDPLTPPIAHDHVEWQFANHICVRLNDPRRFGCVLWTTENVIDHPLLMHLGPEPLTPAFSAHYLLSRAQNKQQAIKPFLMNNQIVVGVGNIYATEALFAAKVHPLLPARELTQEQAKKLVAAIKRILKKSIAHGGTTIRDFLASSGQPGYFSLHLAVYGRAGERCEICQSTIQSIRQGQRTTYYCTGCQKR